MQISRFCSANGPQKQIHMLELPPGAVNYARQKFDRRIHGAEIDSKLEKVHHAAVDGTVVLA